MRRHWLGVVTALFVASACGGSDESAATNTGSGGSGGTTGGGGACPDGSHHGASGCEASLSGWTAGPSLIAARDHHLSFVAETPSGTFLYALAGTTTSGGAANSVERAALAGDGTLGAFESLPALPYRVIGPGFAQVDRGFVIAGGLLTSSDSTTQTLVGHVADDGALSFAPGPALGVSRYHVALVAEAGFVFAVGGLEQSVSGGVPTQTVRDTVERASFDGTTLGAWSEIAPLPGARTHLAAVAHAGAIYVVGGGLNTATTDILRATVSAQGDLGAWTQAGTLPAPRATASVFVFLDHLYVLAGMTSLVAGEQATVLRAPIAADGSVGSFETLAPLPLARAHCHQAPRALDLVFSVGGSIQHADQAEVFIGRLE